MTSDKHEGVLRSEIVETRVELSLSDLCSICSVSRERIEQFVEEGLVEPTGRRPAEWRFSSRSVRRVVVAERLAQDLRLNPAGAALVVDLLDEVRQLRERLRRLEAAGDD